MACITDFVEWYKSMTFSLFLSKGVIMPELLFCSNGSLFCGVPCFCLIMVFIVMDDTFHFLCYLGLVMIQGKWCHYSAFFLQAFCSTEKNVWNTLSLQLYSGIGIVADLPTPKRQKSSDSLVLRQTLFRSQTYKQMWFELWPTQII